MNKPIIAAEHFELTPAIREKVNESAEKLQEFLSGDSSVRVYLSMDADRVFTALFRVHVKKKELVCSKSEEDLYLAISEAASGMRHQLQSRKNKIVGRRVTCESS